MLTGRYIKTQLPALPGADILPWLKHLEIRGDVGSGNNYCTLTDMLSRRREEGTLMRFELLSTAGVHAHSICQHHGRVSHRCRQSVTCSSSS
jgi:hypothetical protein